MARPEDLVAHAAIANAQSDARAVERAEALMWELIDLLAMHPTAKTDPRTWAHLLVYAPKNESSTRDSK